VVITTTGWMKEFVEHEEVGVYVNPDSSSALCKALLLIDSLMIKNRKFYIDVARGYFDKSKLANEFLDCIIR
jgi:hypothetical protein